MNPSKNYNAYPRRGSMVKLVTPIPDKRAGQPPHEYLPERSEREKVRDIKKYIRAGVEENIIGYCHRCDLPHPLARKPRSSDHYNCLEKCCVMLHQWDVCNYCLVDMHGPQPKHDDESRRNEVARFHQVFSRLPDDIKKYIGAYVPLIFNYVESVTRLVFVDRKMANLDRYVTTLPKSTWTAVGSIFSKTYYIKNKINKSSSRKQVCNGVKELYAKKYVEYTQSIVDERDYWTHKGRWAQPRFHSVELVNDIEKAKLLL